MTKMPSARPSVQNLAPYVPGRPVNEVETEYGITEVVKLASNENPLGPSPLALEAAHAALSEMHRYPDGGGFALRRALSERYDVPVSGVVLGAGSSELIDIAIRAFVDPGQEVVIPENIFRMIPIAVGRSGGTLVSVPALSNLKPDIPAMKRRIGNETKIVAIANPNNPTGAYLSRAELEAYFEGLPGHVLTILDEAYFEFANGVVPDYPNGLDFLAAGRPVLVLRTFSKIAGLAGLRIGYGFSLTDIAQAMHKVREPFNTSSVAQAAALAALQDVEHIRRVRDLVLEERGFLERELSARSLPPRPSIANFLLVDVSRPFAPLDSEFARRGVIVRPMGGWGFPNAFRLSVGTRAENLRFLEALDAIQAAGLLDTPNPLVAAEAAT
jgi:histidinol-phosphate aminotransferase